MSFKKTPKKTFFNQTFFSLICLIFPFIFMSVPLDSYLYIGDFYHMYVCRVRIMRLMLKFEIKKFLA